jgi:hypothetical protein
MRRRNCVRMDKDGVWGNTIASAIFVLQIHQN